MSTLSCDFWQTQFDKVHVIDSPLGVVNLEENSTIPIPFTIVISNYFLQLNGLLRIKKLNDWKSNE